MVDGDGNDDGFVRMWSNYHLYCSMHIAQVRTNIENSTKQFGTLWADINICQHINEMIEKFVHSFCSCAFEKCFYFFLFDVPFTMP